MERTTQMPLGVVVERRQIDNLWQSVSWRPVALIVGAPPVSAWRLLREGEGWAHYHAATLPLVLHRKETEGYRYNLSNHPPVVYVVLRLDGEGVVPFLVTASPYEAEAYLNSGEEIVEGVPMDGAVVAWVQAFIDRHHVDEPFVKRQRVRHDPDTGRPPGDPPHRRRGGGHG